LRAEQGLEGLAISSHAHVMLQGSMSTGRLIAVEELPQQIRKGLLLGQPRLLSLL